MNVSRDDVVKIVYQVIDDENEMRELDNKLEKSLDTAFLSKNGMLDSLGLVNFIVATEEKISDCFGKDITIADARAMSQKNSPFRTVNTLVDYIWELLDDNQ